jgi:hypothetical protein
MSMLSSDATPSAMLPLKPAASMAAPMQPQDNAEETQSPHPEVPENAQQCHPSATLPFKPRSNEAR